MFFIIFTAILEMIELWNPIYLYDHETWSGFAPEWRREHVWVY